MSNNPGLTILMPCLNEVRTLPRCIEQAKSYLRTCVGPGEILIADNGSMDGSQHVAEQLEVRVIHVSDTGYGAALRAGIEAARYEYIVMGDSDASYDFSEIGSFIMALEDGCDLVVGNRFLGGIDPGAMPLLHRYLGNPVLSFLGRLFFGGALKDFHCGLRAFRRSKMLQIGLVTPGMEFASEMIVKSLQAGMRVAEVPTVLHKDGRGRPPHLNTWRDGWRHLRYMLLYSPRWLFLYPGGMLATIGVLQLLACQIWNQGQIHWPVGIHTQLFAMAAAVLGFQTLLFAMGAVLARHFAGLDAPHPREQWAGGVAIGPILPVGGVVASLIGGGICLALALEWGATHFGTLNPEVEMRRIIPGVGLLIAGTQSILASIYFAALRSAFDSSRRRRDATSS
jgi:glycosyltransferase involved in cell wall biosynthesis